MFCCEKTSENKPAVVPFPVDTASADQYMVCVIDTIQYIAYTKGSTGPNTVKLNFNTLDLSRFFSEALVTRAGQPCVRNMELTLYNFMTRKIGNYTGAQVFAESKTDLIVNRVDVEEQNWTIFNASTNRVQVTYVDSTIAKGNFSFKMQNAKNPSRFLEVTKGAFKLRLR